MVWKTALGRLLGRKLTLLKDNTSNTCISYRDIIIVPGTDGRKTTFLEVVLH